LGHFSKADPFKKHYLHGGIFKNYLNNISKQYIQSSDGVFMGVWGMSPMPNARRFACLANLQPQVRPAPHNKDGAMRLTPQ
jgi:hypothetical protein